jgi:hypothetical protein
VEGEDPCVAEAPSREKGRGNAVTSQEVGKTQHGEKGFFIYFFYNFLKINSHFKLLQN